MAPPDGLSGGNKLQAYLDGIVRRTQAGVELPDVRVGFLENGTTYENGPNVASVAFWQEFGTSRIPPRPFFRTMIRTNAPKWGAELGKIMAAANYDARVSLTRMGDRMVGQLKKSIIDTAAPPLSPVTLLLRQRFGNNPQEIRFRDVLQAIRDVKSGAVPSVTATQAHPLIWTGTMLNAVDREVNA